MDKLNHDHVLISFYVPETHVELVKEALFDAGAGKMGAYDKTAWQTLGQGQFRPLQGANAFIGHVDEISYVSEYKVEMVCKKTFLDNAIKALIEAHPYECPAYRIEAFWV